MKDDKVVDLDFERIAREPLARTASITRLASDDDKQVTYRVSLSSETPVKDWSWSPPNVLKHSKDAVDLDGISERGLPFFVMHRSYDLNSLVGRIVNVRLVNKRLEGELKFSKANDEAELVRAMIDEGTLTDMSIGAKPITVRRVQDENGNTEIVEWTRWRPLEASAVGVGADQSIGIGRNKDSSTLTAEENAMSEKTKSPAAGVETVETTETPEERTVARVEAGRQGLDEDFAAKQEARRADAIRKLGQTNSIGDETVEQWIQRGYSLDRVADDILSIHKKRGEAGASKSAIGLSDKEAGNYSICRAILAAHSGDWKNAGFELECHDAIAERMNKIPEKGSFFVPLEVQRRANAVSDQALLQVAQRHGLPHLARDLNVATAGAGGYLTQTSNMGFDELLRNASFAFRMGARRLSGLRDNVAIPRQSAAATAEWLTSETDTATESQQTFVQLLMSPKTVSAYTELSRQLLLQATVDAEGLVNADLAAVAALAVDAAVLSGSGASGQPEGLDNVTGVGSVTGTSLAFADILEFQTDVATANVMPMRGGYVTTPSVASLCIQRVKYSNTASPLWEGSIWAGNMQGFPAMSTNQCAAASMYFGDWDKAVIAEWGVLEVETNPFANFPAGIIGVRAMYSVDVGIRYPAAFSKAASIT